MDIKKLITDLQVCADDDILCTACRRYYEMKEKGGTADCVNQLLQDAAEALEKMPQWIPVAERLPENEVDVLVLAKRRLYGIKELDRRTVRVVSMAFHTDGKMNTEESGYNWDLENANMEYDEDADAFIVPEGWWEAVRYGEEFSAVDDVVTHWMPLPKEPKEN